MHLFNFILDLEFCFYVWQPENGDGVNSEDGVEEIDDSGRNRKNVEDEEVESCILHGEPMSGTQTTEEFDVFFTTFCSNYLPSFRKLG